MPNIHIDHISLVVHDLDRAVADWKDILGVLAPGLTMQVTRGSGTDAGTPMVWATYQNPDPTGLSIQIWACPDPNSWVKKMLDKRGEFVHHVAFCSDNFGHTVAECRKAGLPVLQAEDGYPDTMPWLRWNFISPEKAHGPLIELATRYQAVGENWLPHPGNAENAPLAEELRKRYYGDNA